MPRASTLKLLVTVFRRAAAALLQGTRAARGPESLAFGPQTVRVSIPALVPVRGRGRILLSGEDWWR